MEDFDYLQPFPANCTNIPISEDNWASLETCLLVNCILNGICSLTAVIGNGFIIFLIAKYSALRSPSNTLLACIALSDLLVGFLAQPLYVANRRVYLLANHKGPPDLQDPLTDISIVLLAFSFTTSPVINVDSYLVFLSQEKWPVFVYGMRRRVLVVVTVVWTLSGLCGFMWTRNRQIFYFSGLVLTSICFVTITALYLKIFRVGRSRRAEILKLTEEERRQFRVTLVRLKIRMTNFVDTFYVCCLLFLCYFPLFCTAVVIELTGYSLTKNIILEFAVTVTFMNSSLRVVLYYWRFKFGEFRRWTRKFFKRCLKRLGLRKRKRATYFRSNGTSQGNRDSGIFSHSPEVES